MKDEAIVRLYWDRNEQAIYAENISGEDHQKSGV